MTEGGTPHLTIGNARQELRPAVVIPKPLVRRRDPDGRVLTADDQETRAHLVRLIAADPVKQQWLRDYGAALLRSAGRELDQTHPVADYRAGDWKPSEVVERRADEHERGETALW